MASSSGKSDEGLYQRTQCDRQAGLDMSVHGSRVNTPGWYMDPSGRHQRRYFDYATWTAYVADDGVVTTDPEGVEGILRSQRRQRQVRRAFIWVSCALGIFALIGLGSLIFATEQVSRSGKPLVERVKQVQAQLEASGLPCRNLAVNGPELGVSENAVGYCRLDAAHGNEEVMITAQQGPENVDPGSMYPSVVGPDWDIILTRSIEGSDNKVLLRDIATRLGATCVNCDPHDTESSGFAVASGLVSESGHVSVLAVVGRTGLD